MTPALLTPEQQLPIPSSDHLEHNWLNTVGDQPVDTKERDLERLLAAADELIGLGLPIVPADEKAPIGRRWHRRDFPIEELQELLSSAIEPMIGLRMGPNSCIDIEADNPGEERAFWRLFENCDPPVTPTFQSSRGKHRLFQWDARLAAIKKAFCHYPGDDSAKLAILLGAGGKGSQSIIPPSKGRHWIPGLSIEECAFAPLPDLVIDRILEADMSRHSPGYVSPKKSQSHHARSLKDSTSTRPLPDTADILSDTANTSIAMCPPTLEGAIEATIPSGPGFRNRCIFAFARHLKGMAEYFDRPADELESVVRRWHSRALPFIGTKEFKETWQDFQIAWERVEFPARDGVLAEIVREALDVPFPAAAERYESPEIKKLIAVCARLQERAGPSPFFLGCRNAAGLIGGDENQRTRWHGYLCTLCSDGVLVLHKKGSRGRASEYFYRG